MARPRRILFARPADAANVNAQAKNVQSILRHWRSPDIRPTVLAFGPPDAGVAANPNVDILPIPPNRLWRGRVFASYWNAFDAVFCPGVHHIADWLALKSRAAAGWSLPIVATCEGLLSVAAGDYRESR